VAESLRPEDLNDVTIDSHDHAVMPEFQLHMPLLADDRYSVMICGRCRINGCPAIGGAG